jgi:SAM-dependent methyltransferase
MGIQHEWRGETKVMDSPATEKPNYSNWVSPKFIYVPGVIGLLFLGLSFVFLPLIVVAVFFLLIGAYFAYARNRFSTAGGNVQAKVQELVLAHLDWNGNGKALDIGCGNAPLTVALAHKYPDARITGIDYWGAKWAYSKSICERNAQIEGVAARLVFQKASASALPFEDGSFDAAVSNLVFHEVGDTKDKRELIREALRVVRKGGRFAFQDLFLWESIYGKPDELLAIVRSWGVTKVEFVRTCDADFIPSALKLPFMVGTIAVLYGEK